MARRAFSLLLAGHRHCSDAALDRLLASRRLPTTPANARQRMGRTPIRHHESRTTTVLTKPLPPLACTLHPPVTIPFLPNANIAFQVVTSGSVNSAAGTYRLAFTRTSSNPV